MLVLGEVLTYYTASRMDSSSERSVASVHSVMSFFVG